MKFFYSIGILSIFVLFYSLFKTSKEAKLPLSVRRMLRYTLHEVRMAVTDKIRYMHLSIMAGITLSVVYFLIEPFIWQQLRLILFVISIPFCVGLFSAFIWRLVVLRNSQNIHIRLSLGKTFRKNSFWLQFLLIVILLLTLLELLLFTLVEIVPIVNLLFIIRNFLISVYYRKPSINPMLNFDVPLHRIRIPFQWKEVLDGKLDLSKVKIGVEKIVEFEENQLFGLTSCVEIGVCESQCPSVDAGRKLSPRVLIRKIALMEKSVDGNVFNAINEDELWSCTTCGACMASCPVGVRHINIIVDLRRHLTNVGNLDEYKSKLLSNVMKSGNMFGKYNYARHDWLRALGVKSIKESKNPKYLLWVGCMGSFDDATKENIKSLISLLKAQNILDDVAVLCEEESCCGEEVRKLGDESLYQDLVLKNIELFEKYKVKEILTMCPHCYFTFKQEYTEFGMKNIKVLHHIEMLSEILKKSHLKLKKSNDIFVLHDPCYLSRYCGIINEQREIIGMVGHHREPKNYALKTYCCGGGGGNYWYEVSEKKRISHIRLEQLIAEKPSAIVTLCPFCNAMLRDAVTVKGLEEKIKVIDIASLVENSLIL